MKRKVLLVEPNYKNKYPPMGLMKMATYFRESGDDVRFFKGDLQSFVMELDVDKLIEQLEKWNSNVKWKRYKQEFLHYFKFGGMQSFEGIEAISNDIVAQELVSNARRSYKNQDYFDSPEFDFVGVTTLFTFYFDITVKTINFVKKLCKKEENVMVGGIMSSILPDKVFEATGIRPFVGQLDKPGIIDKDDDRIIDHLPLDYSILEEVDYKYPANNGYYAYMTRGCINRCSFCAVPTLEPNYCDFISIKEQIEVAAKRFGEQKDLLLLDNNVLASNSYKKIIEEIKDAGFSDGAMWTPPNYYRISITNLRDHFNDRAYIRKCISIYKDIMKKLPEKESGDFYLLLEKHDLLSVDTATREEILEIDSIVDSLYIQTHKSIRPKRRYIDFNQGMDARLINEDNMELLSGTCIRPLRVAFDHWEMRETYEKALRAAVDNGITHLSNYMLYNFNDKPEELYYRMKMNVELCEELNADIYSFPMKYHPIDDENYYMNRDYIGKYWNRKFIRAVQAVLNATKGAIGRGVDYYYEAFGEDLERFYTILWMPESFIIYRMKFKNTLAKEWEDAFKSLTEEDSSIVKSIVSENRFSNLDVDLYKDSIKNVLKYYKINRDMAAKM